MTYFGAPFPEGISPDIYREIRGVRDITCPLFRRTVLETLNSTGSSTSACLGCGQPEAVRLVVDIDTERIFVRIDSACTAPADTRPTK